MAFNVHLSKNQILDLNTTSGQLIAVKHEDLIHPYISGNKYRKLKYNLSQAQTDGKRTLLTFGGAFSNHIAAVAAVGQQYGFKTIGIIRGEELVHKTEENPTLKLAGNCGMAFKFVTREEFRNKDSAEFIGRLKDEFPEGYIIPEGGTNDLAVKGCEEILTDLDAEYDYICCSVGTGGTISGLINSSKSHQKVLGFPALKGDFLKEEISKFAKNPNWQLLTDYHFGGYAKMNTELIGFMNQFKREHHIQLDPVYTGKLMFGLMDLLKQGYFPKTSKILIIHTGGLQGISGMNAKLKKKHWPLIT